MSVNTTNETPAPVATNEILGALAATAAAQLTDRQRNTYELAADIAAALLKGRYLAVNPARIIDWTEYGYAVQAIAQVITDADPTLIGSLSDRPTE